MSTVRLLPRSTCHHSLSANAEPQRVPGFPSTALSGSTVGNWVLDAVAGRPSALSSRAPSTVKVRMAGVWSVLPTVSVARTLKVWTPSVRLVRVCSEVHVAQSSWSSLHWNVADGSLEKRNAAVVVVIVPVGPASIVVWGAVVSTVKLRVAGVGSVPAPVTARTWNS